MILSPIIVYRSQMSINRRYYHFPDIMGVVPSLWVKYSHP